MATRKVKTRLKMSELKRVLRDFPKILTGEKNDIRGIRKAYWSGFAASMFHDIQLAFDLKADLQADETGDTWKDLAPSTKAYARPARFNDLTTQERNNLRNYRTKGLMNYKQQSIWNGFFNRQRLKLIREGALPSVAANIAAVQAWAFVKANHGVVTKLDKLGFRTLQVLKDKKNLYKSLSQGDFNGVNYVPKSRNQIFKIMRNGCELGTRDPKASFHHRGIKGRMPQRRLWPDDLRKWTARANAAGIQAAINQLIKTIS